METGDSSRSETAHGRFRCRLCGDVIGVYEPLVVCEPEPRLTSRAAERIDGASTYYHRSCFARR
jgi:hypothetical protein